MTRNRYFCYDVTVFTCNVFRCSAWREHSRHLPNMMDEAICMNAVPRSREACSDIKKDEQNLAGAQFGFKISRISAAGPSWNQHRTHGIVLCEQGQYINSIPTCLLLTTWINSRRQNMTSITSDFDVKSRSPH